MSPSALAPLQALYNCCAPTSARRRPLRPSNPWSTRSRKFNAAIQSMKIDGPVGEFLRDASTTGADPRALFEPEIKKYLDDNPQLWAALRVGLK